MIKAIYVFVALALLAGVASLFFNNQTIPENGNGDAVACTMDAMQCPDGSYVGRSGPNCEFVCGSVEVPADIKAHIESKSDLIKVTSPIPYGVVTGQMIITGEARGYWYFEASFPIFLTNWDGLIIAEGYATALDNWMTEEFVPYTANLTFTNPYNVGDPDFMQKGTLILKKDNPSALPENDDALEIPVTFAQ